MGHHPLRRVRALALFLVLAAPASADVSRTPTEAFAALVAAQTAGDASAAQSALDELAAFPRAGVRPVLERAADASRPADDARAALVAFERFGTTEDLALMTVLAREGLEDDAEAALSAIAKREASALTALERLSRAAASPVRRTIVRAIERVGTLAAASSLARCSSSAGDDRPEVIARIGRLVEGLPQPAPDDVLDVVRSAIGGIGSNALRDAVIAAGRLEDGESIPYLVPLLREEDAGLRADATWALERISGLALHDRPAAWETWYAGELAWWREESDTAFAYLESADPAARTRALYAISGRRASRDRLSLRVAPLLEDPEPAVARLAARTLQALRSKVAVAPLLAALESPDAELARAACGALGVITRKEVPCDPLAWRAAAAP